ncbi:MAG: hypothetical protein GWN00_02115, partial [Aliifodinibius sp.]|nr:polymer-forming cytoskeletal protein [Fodinibius sp.]NIV12194.1 hypothetical protein [Fodinibius sp.]NIY23652.1 hypothetical protein [Fodinibius sp.]
MMARVFYTFCFILIILIGILPVYLYGQNIHQEDTKELRARAESRYLADTHKIPIRRYFHSTEIKPDEVINGHVVVVKGDLGIWGKVNGDVLTLYGDVEVFDNSAVNGNITSVGGRVILHDNGKVEGNMLETHWKNLLTDQNSFLRFHSYDNYTPYSKFEIPDSDHQIALRYNRVEGVFLGLEVPRQWRYPTAHLSGYGFVGYGFESKDIRYQIGLDRWFIDSMDYRTEIGAEYHDLTDTKDLWRVGYTENSLAAVFFKQDYHDYFRRKGFSVYLRQNLTRAFLIGIEYRNDDYESLRSNTNWALFGGDKNFRRNPLLGGDEGTMRSIYTEISLDTRDNFEHPRKGWYINLSA